LSNIYFLLVYRTKHYVSNVSLAVPDYVGAPSVAPSVDYSVSSMGTPCFKNLSAADNEVVLHSTTPLHKSPGKMGVSSCGDDMDPAKGSRKENRSGDKR
jgi:hypothetical protein